MRLNRCLFFVPGEHGVTVIEILSSPSLLLLLLLLPPPISAGKAAL
jgi:hypothetical protein